MAGYIGSKAVLLSTTAATVTGNASIGGNLTLGGNIDVSSGTIKLDGNYPVGSNNVALGDTALDSLVSGIRNTAIGSGALTANTGNENTAVGYLSAYSNTTGTPVNAFGREALYSNTTGNHLVAIGEQALYANTSGSYNTALGNQSLISNTTASKNTAVGYQAGYVNTTGYENVFVGYQSGYNNTGYGNNYIGYGAGVLMTSGNANTILGKFSGNQGGLDIRTKSNNIVLSDGDGNPKGYYGNQNAGGTANGWRFDGGQSTASYTSCLESLQVLSNQNSGVAWGIFVTGDASTSGGNAFRILDSSTGNVVGTISYNTTSASYNTSSDYRLKENVVELTGATDRLKQIPVHRFNFISNPDATVDGFLAHEVQAIVPEAVHGTKDEVDADGNPVYQGIDQSKLAPLLTAALQEALQKIDALEARVAALEAV